MERKGHKILEVKEDVYDRHPDLVERIRKVQQRVNQARRKLHGSGVREQNTLTSRRDASWIAED